MTQKFQAFNPKNWERIEHFHYYSKIASTGYTINTELDISLLIETLKNTDYKFYAAYIYAVTSCINNHPEFRTSIVDEVPGYWNNLTPLYPVFHENDKTTSLMWTEYSNDFKIFHNDYLKDKNNFGENHGFLSKPGMPPQNCYIISCIPWISFKSFSLHNYGESNYYLPSIEAGKYYHSNKKILLPFSITIHHASADGYHVNSLLNDIQNKFINAADWLLI